jgi:hypothetical protein
MKNIWLKSLFTLTPCILSQCNTSEKEIPLKDRPNILIAIGDDISYPHMGAYGCSWIKTPGFDRHSFCAIILLRMLGNPVSHHQPM